MSNKVWYFIQKLMILCCSILGRRTMKPQTCNHGWSQTYPRWDLHMWESPLFPSWNMNNWFHNQSKWYKFAPKSGHMPVCQVLRNFSFEGVTFWNIKKTNPFGVWDEISILLDILSQKKSKLGIIWMYSISQGSTRTILVYSFQTAQ